jgi:HK97 family phage portal protein
MDWFKWFRRSVPTWTTSQSAADFHALFGSGPSAAGIIVTPEKALEVPAVFSCLQVISQDIARTPIKFRRITSPDTLVDATEHDLYEILGSLPNPEQTAFQVKHALQWQLLQHGRAYAEIVRRDGRIVALWPLDSCHMRVDRDAQRRKRWHYTAGGQTITWTFEASQPPIFELTMETPITRCRDLIGLALALQTYQSKFFANGGRPTGVLQIAGAISQGQADALRQNWTSIYGRPENSHKVLLLEGGLEFKPIAIPNDEAQMIEAQHAITQAICGTFRVPLFKVSDLSKATYSNMSASAVEYVTSTLDPIYQAWEDSIRRDLLTNRQYGTFTAQFDRNALIRSDVAAQHAALASGIQSGYYSQNDARRMLWLNPNPDGDTYRINAALVPVDAQPTTEDPDARQ